MSGPGRPNRESSLVEEIAKRPEGRPFNGPSRPNRESSLGDEVAKRPEGRPFNGPGRPNRESSLGEDALSSSRQTAVALSYREGDQAPRVVAKGYGVLAETIQRTAREHGLYVHESPELVGLLMQVDLDSRIPPQLYQAVAELLAWLYRLDALDPDSATAQATPLAAGLHDPSESGRDPR